MTQHYKNSTTIYKGKVGSHGTRGKVHNVLGSQPCSITYKNNNTNNTYDNTTNNNKILYNQQHSNNNKQ